MAEMAKILDSVAAHLRAGEVDAGYSEISRLVRETNETPERDVLYRELVGRLGAPSARIGACFAIAAGAMVESGADPQPLGHAIRAPLTRALIAAKRCIELAETIEDELAIEGGQTIGDAQLSPEKMRELIAEDPVAVEAFFSLGTWYRPAIASWTRARAALAEAREDTIFQGALAEVREAVEGGDWLAALSAVLQDAPFVVLIPELQKGYSFALDGCTDVGQLMILLADALGGDIFAELGCASRAPHQAIVEVMTGAGPQSISENYSADFHLFPRQSLAALPPDFLPSAIAPIDGARVLLLVGPKTLAFTQQLPVSRMFDPLRAQIARLRPLSAQETQTWMARLE